MGDGIGFDPCWRFPILNSWGKNVIIFNGLSVHIDNKKYILVLGKGPKQGLDDTTIIAEIEYSINLSRSHKKFVWAFIIMEATVFYLLIPQNI